MGAAAGGPPNFLARGSPLEIDLCSCMIMTLQRLKNDDNDSRRQSQGVS